MLLYYRPAVQQYVLHDRLPPCAGPPWPAFVHDSAQRLELLRLLQLRFLCTQAILGDSC